MYMYLVATLVLVSGLIDDLRSRKVHNVLILALLAATVAASIFFRGLEGSLPGVGAMLLALVITLPLFMAGVLGGGDVKLFSVFAFAVNSEIMFWTLVYSFIWGAVFGVLKASIQNQLPLLVRNTYKAARRQKIQIQELNKIPYTFALLLGWLTQLTLLRVEGAL